MRKILPTMLVVGLLSMAFTGCIADGSGGDSDVLFYEVKPTTTEGFSLFNYGSSDVNLKGYFISDGEGEIEVLKDLIIKPNSRITFANAIVPGDGFTDRGDVYLIGGEYISKNSRFAIADAGDDLYLKHGGKVVDAVCFGNKVASEGWVEDAVSSPSKKFIMRVGIVDTDSKSDWVVTLSGYTNLPFDPDLYFNAVVSPFTFPESDGVPIYNALENAKESIQISMYQLKSENVVALLCELESRTEGHVEIQVLIEGGPLGSIPEVDRKLLMAIENAGGEVRLIDPPMSSGTDRYSYVHNKYAIIDEEIVIITSENWTGSNMSSSKDANRGWGAIVESDDYARYMGYVFSNDWSLEFGDVMEFEDAYPHTDPYGGLSYVSPTYAYDYPSFNAKVMPILSPDNSFETLRRLMSNAKYRIFSEQLDLGSSFQNIANDGPLAWMNDATDKGVDARLILDATFESLDEMISRINDSTSVKTVSIKGGDGFRTTHNKGIVIDDCIWLGSVNWTSNSFLNNRETAIFIDSTEVTDYFLEFYMKDWDDNNDSFKDYAFKVKVRTDGISDKKPIIFSVSGPETGDYIWDVYGDGNRRSSSGNTIVCEDMVPGTYTLKVHLSGTDYYAEYTYTVAAEKAQDEMDENIKLAAVAAIVIILILIFVLKRVF